MTVNILQPDTLTCVFKYSVLELLYMFFSVGKHIFVTIHNVEQSRGIPNVQILVYKCKQKITIPAYPIRQKNVILI